MNGPQVNESIILGALFHDIEKFYPGFWDSEISNSAHIKAAGEFWKDPLVLLANEFQSCERIKGNATKKSQKELENLLPSISLKTDASRRGGTFISRQKLVYSNLGKIFGKACSLKDLDEYKISFFKEIKAVSSSLSFSSAFSRYAMIFQKYLWCEPANSEDEVADISLWEHLALTSAIAACLLRYCENKGDCEALLDKMEKEIGSSNNGEEKPFQLIVGDFSGVQKYIFELATSKKAARRLKGRSFLVQMISEDIKRYIISKLKLYQVNAIMSAGGKFIILVPALSDMEKTFGKIKNEVEDRIYSRFKGEIKFNLAISESFKGEEFGGYTKNAGNFGKYFDDAFIALSKTKYRPLESILMENGNWKEENFCTNLSVLPDDETLNLKLCKSCKKYIINPRYYKEAREVDEAAICQNCGEEIRIGKQLSKGGRYIVWLPESQDQIAKDKNVKLLFSNIVIEKEISSYSDNFITIINPEEAAPENHRGGLEARFFATYTPTKLMGEERIGKDFSEMLKDELENEKRKGVGFRKLAVLKGDVDSLGKTFYFGLKSSKPDENAYTAARLKTLSMYLNLFFGGYVNWLVEKNDKYKNLYIIFSGGDDFTIVGYWETLIDFARELRCSFDKFASNPEVHFSATIHLMDENWPIYGEVEKADEELVNAKNADENKEKNGVCVFGKAILWKDFDFAMELIEGKNVPGQPLDPGFGKYVAAETVSMGYVRQLHRIAQMIASLTDKDKLKGLTQKQKISLLMWQPYLHYFTERNLAKKQPPPEELWVKSHLYAKDAAALKDLNIFTTYLLYKNRK